MHIIIVGVVYVTEHIIKDTCSHHQTFTCSLGGNDQRLPCMGSVGNVGNVCSHSCTRLQSFVYE